MANLDELRMRIDKADEKLIKALEERLETVLEIGRYKKENNIPIIDKEREEIVLEKAILRVKNKDFGDEITKIFSNIIKVCEDMQKTP